MFDILKITEDFFSSFEKKRERKKELPTILVTRGGKIVSGRSCSLIFLIREVLKRTVVAYSYYCFDNLSGSHYQSQVKSYLSVECKESGSFI